MLRITSPGYGVVLALTIGHIGSGCTSLVPHHGGVSALSNGITEYRTPTFDNKVSWFGWTLVGAMSAGGAYQGYRSNLALRWTGWERRAEIQPIGNAALGAFAGLASGLLVTWLTGGSPPAVTSDNAEDWLDHIDDRLMLIPTDTLHPGLELASIRGIARNADAAFSIRTMDDARLFLTMFPRSPHRDDVLGRGVSGLKRDSLLPFAILVRGLPAEELAMRRYIGEIMTFDNAMAAATRFVSYRPLIEQRAASLANTLNDLERFISAFPESSYTDTIALHLRDGLRRDEIPAFVRMFPMLKGQLELKRRYINTCTSVTETIRAMHLFPELRNEAERQAASLAQSIDDYRAYLRAFPEGPAATEMTRRLKAELDLSEPDWNSGSETQYDADDE